ncbi:NINE protein (plasmid) [Borreliella bavariensis]|uniref:TM2 domain-containing protein n=1 Tax=Borrelia garinii subsp. bavariensis (strain ATCC BAA-2496 / DSM 23469 / PBi) TaxID=290434 RepID=A0A7I6GX98_BORGP|nr:MULTISPECIES: NINE protein [Borreliella]AAU85898.1 hypothetical protein BGP048 [Borreliella bavariensis PBi]WLN24586.1 NINE protein [Borreliella bavariensis]
MSKALDEIYCHSCGKPLKKEAEICIACGVRNKHAESHNKILLLLICLFFGCLGAHRFYVGQNRNWFFIPIYRWLVIDWGFH